MNPEEFKNLTEEDFTVRDISMVMTGVASAMSNAITMAQETMKKAVDSGVDLEKANVALAMGFLSESVRMRGALDELLLLAMENDAAREAAETAEKIANGGA